MPELIEKLNSKNKIFYFHPSSFIDDGAIIGENTRIWHFCHIMNNAVIGKNCVLGQNVFVGKKAVIGNGVKIQNNVSIYDDIIIEDDVFCGPSCVFTNVTNPRSFIDRKAEYKTTVIKKGTTIGANATIVCGVKLGKYCFIGAGSVVTKDIPDYALIYGVPGIIKGWMCKCGVELKSDLKCTACNSKFRLVNNLLEEI